MALLAPLDRLQPALLDRLVDDEPDKTMESREARLITVRRLRAAVLRDLAWLFNAIQPSEEELDPARFPEAANSVLGYGLPALAGGTMSSLNASDLEARIKQAIIDFEPRMVAATLNITAKVNSKSADHHNQVQIEIRGSLWSQPVPIELLLRTDVDLETGDMRLQDLST